MEDSAQLVGFYEQAYSTSDPSAGAFYARWRALSALGKAEHVIALCNHAGLEPQSTLEVGCGDGAVLSELARRGFGGRLQGVEITQAAVDIASRRQEIEAVRLYDGTHLDWPEGSFELGILSHVLEHVPDPSGLLREVARVCGAVVVEVPLEANLSARRPSRRAHAAHVGHLQRLSSDRVRSIVQGAGLRVAGELEDPLGLAVQRFFARGRRARLAAWLKWALRSAVHRVAPGFARRLFTVHYACLCLPA